MADPDAPGPRWLLVLVDPHFVMHDWAILADRATAAQYARRLNGHMHGIGQHGDPNRRRPAATWVVLSAVEFVSRWPHLATYVTSRA